MICWRASSDCDSKMTSDCKIEPVHVMDQTLVVARAEMIQQQLLFPIETQEVGDGKCVLREARDALHHIVWAEMQMEVVPCFSAARHDVTTLQDASNKDQPFNATLKLVLE